MDSQPGFPTPLGVLRAVESPRYEDVVHEQIARVRAERGSGDIAALLRGGDTWEVPAGPVSGGEPGRGASS
jgi:2-oxoglutarate ferredoxin oxidoreductase subunit beta